MQDSKQKSTAIKKKEITRRGLLILDCTSELEEQKSEGLLLKELLRILKPTMRPRVKTINGVPAFKKQFKNSCESIIHISAHGRHYKSKPIQGTVLGLPSGDFITTEDVRNLLDAKRLRERPLLMVLSACHAGYDDMVKAITQERRCRYLVAPLTKTYWFDAAIFLTVFYRLLIVDNFRPWNAFRKTDEMRRMFFPKFSGDWGFYEDGKLCFSSEGKKLSFRV